jgi:hypothetical protein
VGEVMTNLTERLKQIKERADAATESPYGFSEFGLPLELKNHAIATKRDVPMLLDIVNELMFIFDDELSDCNCDVDYCCPMHRFEQVAEKYK